jgi:hypothetical protein
MNIQDAFVKQHAEWLEGAYDCLDPIVLNGYFLPDQNGGGMRSWWERLPGDPVQTLKKNSLLKMGWVFAKRVRQWGERAGVPVIDVPFKTRKHELAQEQLAARRAKEPDFREIFSLVPKLQLWSELVFEALLRQRVTRHMRPPPGSWSFQDKCAPKLELGSEGGV